MVDDLLNENDEEIVRSYSIVLGQMCDLENTNVQREEEMIFDSNEVLPWTFKEIEILLLSEVKETEGKMVTIKT